MQGKGQFDDDAFIGRIDFGRYNDKQVAVTTYGDEVYVHIKDRSRGRAMTLRGTDYLQLLKKKGQITTLLEQGGKHIAKKRRLEDSFFDDSVPIIVDSDSEANIEETLKKFRKAEANAAKKRLKAEAEQKKAVKSKKLKRSNSTVSSLVSSDDSSDGEEKEKEKDKDKEKEGSKEGATKKAPNKQENEGEASQSSPKEEEEDESDDGSDTPPINKQLPSIKQLSELKKKHKKKSSN